MATETDPRLLGRGIYDVVEVAWLIGRSPDTVAHWTSKRARAGAFLEPLLDGLFNFHDLISLYVISELLRRGVKRKDIIAGGHYMAEQLDISRPYAHERLATVGASFFGEIDKEWLDVGKGGQAAFAEVVQPLLRPIDFGADGLASLWRPAPGVALNPEIQSGSPCVEGTRVPTRLLVELVASGPDDELDAEEVEDLADDYNLTPGQVRAAITYEWHHLASAA